MEFRVEHAGTIVTISETQFSETEAPEIETGGSQGLCPMTCRPQLGTFQTFMGIPMALYPHFSEFF